MTYTLTEAKALVSSYDTSYSTLLAELVQAKVDLKTADALLDTLIAAGASSDSVKTQNDVVTACEATITSKQDAIKTLITNYESAQDVINDNFSLPDPDSVGTSPFVGYTGPTGERGATGPSGGSTGPTGPSGKTYGASSVASVGTLAVSTSISAPSASFTSAMLTTFTSSTATIGKLVATSLDISGVLSLTSLSAASASLGVATATSVTTDYLTVTGICTTQGLVSATSVYVSSTTTAVGGFVGTLLTGVQTGITQVGTLTGLTVSGLTTAASLSVSGLCTASGGFVGSLLTGVQTAITQVGTLSSLNVSGIATTSSLSVTGLCTSTGGYVGTVLTANQTNITGLGTVGTLTVSGVTTTGSLSVTGISTSSGGLVGTLLTASQPNITGVGTLTSLQVSGTLSLSGAISQSSTSDTCFISTTSQSTKNCIILSSDSGNTQYEVGVRGSTGVPNNSFYITNLKTSGTSVGVDRLVVNSSGYCGICTSSPYVQLDVGGCNSTILGSLTNSVAYFGTSSSGGGVVVGVSDAPYIAASRTSAGTSLGLNFYTGSTLRMSLGTSGDVTIPGTLSVGGMDFASAIGGLGYNQTWSTYSTGVRTTDTNYQNSTSRPIMVSICLTVSGTAATNTYSFSMGTSTSAMTTYQTGSTTINATLTVDSCNFSVIVPPSYYYKIAKSGSSTTTITLWSELR